MKKKFWLVLCMIACIFAVTACSTSASAASKTSASYDEKMLKDTTESYLTSWNETDFASILADETQQVDEKTIAMFTEWEELKSTIGEFDSITDSSIKENEEGVTVTLIAKYSKTSIDFSISYDTSSQMTIIKAEKHVSMKDKLQKALLNTAMGLSVVFAVLIFISFVIGLLKYVPKILDKLSNKEVVQIETKKAVSNVIATIEETETVELTDDLELIAVVTAAIMASMGSAAPAEGLVVRSIRRKNTNNWNKA